MAQKYRTRSTSMLAVVASMSAHACLAAAFIMRPMLTDTGIQPEPSSGTSIEVALSSMVESAELASARAGGDLGELEELVPEEVVPETTEVAAVEDQSFLERQKGSAALSAVAGAHDVDDAVSADKPDEIEVRDITPKPRRKSAKRIEGAKPAPGRHERKTRRARRGAGPGKSLANSAASRAKRSASRGNMAGYAAQVRSRVVRRWPSGGGARGTVVVAFSVSRSGRLALARIARSSGSTRLDSSVLRAVRGAGPFLRRPMARACVFPYPLRTDISGGRADWLLQLFDRFQLFKQCVDVEYVPVLCQFPVFNSEYINSVEFVFLAGGWYA